MKKSLIILGIILVILVNSIGVSLGQFSGFVGQMIENGSKDLFNDLDKLLAEEGYSLCGDTKNRWDGFPKYPKKILVYGLLGTDEWNSDDIAVYGFSGEDGSCLFKKIIYFACLDLDCSKYSIKEYLQNDAEQTINCWKSQSGNLIIEECDIE